MHPEGLELDDLVSRVRAAVRSGVLAQLDTALMLGEMMSARADELTLHFVQLARGDGHSWTVIGQRLGVSKQAARERFGDRTDPLSVVGELAPTLRLRACLDAAEAEAGGQPVRTDHQLIGLFQDGVGAAILERLGLRTDDVRVTAGGIETEVSSADTALAEGVEARRSVERAAELARQAGHNYLGTEHLLAALLLDPGSRARRVLQQLEFDFPAAKRELDQCLKPKRIARRRRRHQGAMTCSFCGKKRGDGVRLVAGPGVCICADCVKLAQEAMTEGTAC